MSKVIVIFWNLFNTGQQGGHCHCGLLQLGGGEEEGSSAHRPMLWGEEFPILSYMGPSLYRKKCD
jgi:hypothetical protein